MAAWWLRWHERIKVHGFQGLTSERLQQTLLVSHVHTKSYRTWTQYSRGATHGPWMLFFLNRTKQHHHYVSDIGVWRDIHINTNNMYKSHIYIYIYGHSNYVSARFSETNMCWTQQKMQSYLSDGKYTMHKYISYIIYVYLIFDQSSTNSKKTCVSCKCM